jgi:hypothetical protein
VSRHIKGIQQRFQDSLNFFDPVNVSKAHQKALHLEKTIFWKPLGMFGGGGSGNNSRLTVPHVVRSPNQSLSQARGLSTGHPNWMASTSSSK